jgi:hypothetical protein
MHLFSPLNWEQETKKCATKQEYACWRGYIPIVINTRILIERKYIRIQLLIAFQRYQSTIEIAISGMLCTFVGTEPSEIVLGMVLNKEKLKGCMECSLQAA